MTRPLRAWWGFWFGFLPGVLGGWAMGLGMGIMVAFVFFCMDDDDKPGHWTDTLRDPGDWQDPGG